MATTVTAPASPAPRGKKGKSEKQVVSFSASQWVLMWWKFRRHKVAMVCAVVTISLYLIALFAEFLAPFPSEKSWQNYTYAPPQALHFIDRTPSGTKLGLYVNGYSIKIEQAALRRVFTIDPTAKIPISLFVKGEPYKLLWLIPTGIHLFGPADPQTPVFLFGADRVGRDVFSRLIYGTRISLSIGLIGVLMSLVFGIVLGGISGYYGGRVDTIIQRVIEFVRSIPTIPLWMGLAAALPKEWGPLQVYFGITLILSLIGWTWMARMVRGKFLSLRSEDFVIAARLDGCSEMRIILRHMVPSFMSLIIATVTLSIPNMIISETALSFLGLGLRPPVVSWGVLLQESQNIRAVATAPWLLVPGLAVVVAVLAINFLGDGLRDASDPYAT
jgi:peptide/nickel transport system permease protein